MERIKGIVYAALSSATFGLAPFFTLSLIYSGYSTFEALAYRWGTATVFLTVVGLLSGVRFRLSPKDFVTIFFLSLFRAATSFCLVVAYQNIASGVASIVHFMYPLVVALTMIFVYGEKKSGFVLVAILVSVIGAMFLSFSDISNPNGGNAALGIAAAALSVFAYAGYIIGVRKTRAVRIASVPLTCYVMGIGALIFVVGGMISGGIRIETDPNLWLYIAGLGIVATAISNITLVKGIKLAGPTLTSVLGALEPLTAVFVGATVFCEAFTWNSVVGIVLIVSAVTLVVLRKAKG